MTSVASTIFQDTAPSCQSCGARLTRTLVDLGLQPLSNAYVPLDRADASEPVYPLHARVCDVCLLVQVDDVTSAASIFNADYAYFSSFSDSWLEHCRNYAAAMTQRFALGPQSLVVEIASNDGYMLQYFVAKGVPVLGVEPSGNVAAAAEARNVPTEVAFFNRATATRLAEAGYRADLIAAKNVMAHVPDINDFVAGVPVLLKPEGVFTVEFPHLLSLIEQVKFDTIYHEHYTYLSLLAVKTVFERHGLTIFDVEKQPTHGGSLRVFARHDDASQPVTANVEAVLDEERAAGLDGPAGYAGFDDRVRAVRAGLLDFLASARAEGKRVVGYGAAAKGNTLLNYAGVTSASIDFVVDRNPAKQDTLLPGSHIPVRDPAALDTARPDYVLILPWNLKREIMTQLAHIREWGGRFVTAIPTIEID